MVDEVKDDSGLKTFVDPTQLGKDVSINPADLDDAMVNHASLFVYYAGQAAYARRQYERMKAAFEILESRLDGHHREALLSSKDGKKPTEAQIKASVSSDPKWSGAQVKLIEAQTMMRLAEDAKEAFSHRRDMVLELARDRRKEKEGQLRVMEQGNARDTVHEILKGSGAIK